MPPPSPTDAELLGDQVDPAGSFSLFYRRHVRGVLAWCAHRGLSAEDAADLTGDVFVAALCARSRFDPSMGESAAAWLRGIAFNIAAGAHRKRLRERAATRLLHADPFVLSAPDVEQYAALRTEVRELLANVAALPPAQRDALIASRIEGATYAELAAAAQSSEQAVRSRVSRAAATLRRRIGTEA